MFVPHRIHIYGPPRPVTGMALHSLALYQDISSFSCYESYEEVKRKFKGNETGHTV
jgi:hypothetical protein